MRNAPETGQRQFAEGLEGQAAGSCLARRSDFAPFPSPFDASSGRQTLRSAVAVTPFGWHTSPPLSRRR